MRYRINARMYGRIGAWPRARLLTLGSNGQVSYRLPPALIRLVEEEAMAAGRAREGGGRAYNPSAVVERVLQAYFDGKGRGTKKPSRRTR